jgi:hypothetical protein
LVLTKSIRLTEEEARELDDLVRESGEVEAGLLKRAALRGLREDRVDRAVLAYLRGASAEQAAALAHLPRAPFVDLLAERGIRILDDPSSVPEELELLARLGGDLRLAGAAAAVRDDPGAAPSASRGSTTAVRVSRVPRRRR